LSFGLSGGFLPLGSIPDGASFGHELGRAQQQKADKGDINLRHGEAQF